MSKFKFSAKIEDYGFKNNETVFDLPNTFNWFYHWGFSPEVAIIHYITLEGKKQIIEQMERLSALSFFKNDWSLER